MFDPPPPHWLYNILFSTPVCIKKFRFLKNISTFHVLLGRTHGSQKPVFEASGLLSAVGTIKIESGMVFFIFRLWGTFMGVLSNV